MRHACCDNWGTSEKKRADHGGLGYVLHQPIIYKEDQPDRGGLQPAGMVGWRFLHAGGTAAALGQMAGRGCCSLSIRLRAGLGSGIPPELRELMQRNGAVRWTTPRPRNVG